jgi:hypothetical protein
MTCSEARRFLEAYLDSELDTETTARVNDHLDRCEPCEKRFRAERRLEKLLAERIGEVPAGAEERFGRILGRAVRPRRRRLLAIGAVAATFLAAGLSALLPRPEPTLVDLARRDHTQAVTGGGAGAVDPALLASLEPRWGKLPPAGYEIVAAHPCRLGRVVVTYVGLRREGRLLSLFDVPRGVDVSGQAPEAAVVRRGEDCCVLVGPDAPALALQLGERSR